MKSSRLSINDFNRKLGINVDDSLSKSLLINDKQ